MEISFLGAAREVTGSCHLLRVNDHGIALDFGLFQGRRRDTHHKNAVLPPEFSDLSAVILSHAHIDHSGRLPLLAKYGYDRPIYSTPATRDLCALMLADSAHIQAKDAEFLSKRRREVLPPLYAPEHAADILRRFISVHYDRPFDVAPGVRATFVEAGHILGSASVVLDCTEGSRERRIVFSGDVGRAGLPIIRDPRPPEGADAVIMESTYGDREHIAVGEMAAKLGAIVSETAARGGRVLIPAFAVGRTQELLYDLHRLARARQIPEIPIFIDSPLAIDATAVFAMHPDTFDPTEDLVASVPELFRFDLAHYVRDASESRSLNTRHGPMIVIAGSGMAEAGRILHHLLHGASDPRNTILIVGFQAEHTLGRRIVERRPSIKVFGEEIPLRARVEILNGYSAHADRIELAAWLNSVRGSTKKELPVWLVHGEPGPQDAFAERLRGDGYKVSAPSRGERVSV